MPRGHKFEPPFHFTDEKQQGPEGKHGRLSILLATWWWRMRSNFREAELTGREATENEPD